MILCTDSIVVILSVLFLVIYFHTIVNNNRMSSDSPGTSTAVKRKFSNEGECSTKPLCKYGKNCYRKIQAHLQEFSHPDGMFRCFPIHFTDLRNL